MPIRWEEPFGMVMVEAMACGTPVIAFPEGAARELVVDGRTGFLVERRARDGGRDRPAAADRCARLPRLGGRHCDVDVVAAAYERTYRSVALPRTAMALARV